jgi:hypothetical protein
MQFGRLHRPQVGKSGEERCGQPRIQLNEGVEYDITELGGPGAWAAK